MATIHNQEVLLVHDAPGKHWKTLCEQAATENDPEKFLELIQEINNLLEQKRLHLSDRKIDNQPSSD
jgi:hypothetical protein